MPNYKPKLTDLPDKYYLGFRNIMSIIFLKEKRQSLSMIDHLATTDINLSLYSVYCFYSVCNSENNVFCKLQNICKLHNICKLQLIIKFICKLQNEKIKNKEIEI